MTKRKLSDIQKLRREVEVLKAQVNKSYAEFDVIIPKQTNQTPATKPNKESTRHTLPIKEIRKDLIRVGVFSAVSILFIISLGVAKVDLSALSQQFLGF